MNHDFYLTKGKKGNIYFLFTDKLIEQLYINII